MGRPLEDNVAVVMGAGAGYGRAVAIALGQAGAIVLAADRDPELAEDTAATVRELGGSGEGFAVHPCDGRGVRAMASATVQHFGRIDVCVVAPFPPAPGPLVEAADERWHAYLEEALVAPQVAIQACVREMLATGHAGDIILVAPPDDPGAAGLVRAGTLALARWWEAELRPTGIRVAALEPRHHDATDSLHALVAVACVTVTAEASAPGAFAAGPR